MQEHEFNETFGMYVPVVLPDNEIVTAEDGVILRGSRTIMNTSFESNAYAIAGRHGIRQTKILGRLAFDDAGTKILNGIAVVLKPVEGSEAMIDYDALKLERHTPRRLLHQHTNIVEAKLSAESYAISQRQLALLKALAERGFALM